MVQIQLGVTEGKTICILVLLVVLLVQYVTAPLQMFNARTFACSRVWLLTARFLAAAIQSIIACWHNSDCFLVLGRHLRLES